jgi:hypothetical protein
MPGGGIPISNNSQPYQQLPSGGVGGYVSPYSQGYAQPYNPNPNALPGVSFGLPTNDNPYEFRGLFNDPSTVPLMSALTSRIGQLAAPGPQYSEYEGALRSGLSQLMTPLANDPTVGAALSKLLVGGGGMPSNPYEGQYATHTGEQYAQLMQEPFSAGEEAAMKERYFGQIELDRGTARQQTLEHLASMGIAPTSGTAVAALQQADQHFDQLRAQAQNQLLTDTVDLRDKRHAAALAASQGLAGYGQGEQQIAASFRNIQMQAAAQAAQLALQQREQAQARLVAGINVGGGLAQLQQQRYQQQQTNWDQLLQLAGVPSALVQQRMGALGQAMGSPGDIGGGYGQLATGYGSEATAQRNQNVANTNAAAKAFGNVYDAWKNQPKAPPPQYSSYNAGYYQQPSATFSGGAEGPYPYTA